MNTTKFKILSRLQEIKLSAEPTDIIEIEASFLIDVLEMLQEGFKEVD